jgi:hypothetical protein
MVRDGTTKPEQDISHFQTRGAMGLGTTYGDISSSSCGPMPTKQQTARAGSQMQQTDSSNSKRGRLYYCW